MLTNISVEGPRDPNAHERCVRDILVEDRGTLESPGYPRPGFPNLVHCVYVLRAVDPGRELQLEFEHVQLSGDCDRDRIEIFPGFDSAATSRDLDAVTTVCDDSVVIFADGGQKHYPFLGKFMEDESEKIIRMWFLVRLRQSE